MIKQRASGELDEEDVDALDAKEADEEEVVDQVCFNCRCYSGYIPCFGHIGKGT